MSDSVMNLAVATIAILDPLDNGFGAIISCCFFTLQIYKK
jgi:hypothetical protein